MSRATEISPNSSTSWPSSRKKRVQFSSVLINSSSPALSGHLYADWYANWIVWVVCGFVPERGHQCELALPGNSRKTINDRKKTEEKHICIYKALHKKGLLSDKKNIIKKWEGKSSVSFCGILNHIMVSIQLENWFKNSVRPALYMSICFIKSITKQITVVYCNCFAVIYS